MLDGVTYINLECGHLDAATKRILEFSSFKDGWDYGEGCSFAPQLIDDALAWNERLIGLGFHKTNASPGTAGELAISASIDAFYIEVILEIYGKYSVAFDLDRRQVLYVNHLPAKEAETLVREIANYAWTAHISSIPQSTIAKMAGFFEQPSAITGDHYRSLMFHAQSVEAEASVSMLEKSINNSLTSLENPLFIGDLTRQYYRLEAA